MEQKRPVCERKTSRANTHTHEKKLNVMSTQLTPNAHHTHAWKIAPKIKSHVIAHVNTRKPNFIWFLFAFEIFDLNIFELKLKTDRNNLEYGGSIDWAVYERTWLFQFIKKDLWYGRIGIFSALNNNPVINCECRVCESWCMCVRRLLLLEYFFIVFLCLLLQNDVIADFYFIFL